MIYGPAKRYQPGTRSNRYDLRCMCRRSGVQVSGQAQLAGAAVWTAGTTVAGFLAVRSVPGLTRYLMPVIAAFTAVSLAAAAVSAVRARRRGQAMPYGRQMRRPPHFAGSAKNREVL